MSKKADVRDEHVDPDVVASAAAFEGRVWDVRAEAFVYNGERIEREYVDHTGAVAIVAIDDEGRMLLIQQYRHPIRARDWEVPAGLLDVADEEPLAAARRELAEEADLVAARWDALVSIYTSPGGSNEMVHLFLARELSDAGERFARSEEEADIRVEWMPLDEVVAAVLAGRMHNGIMGVGALAAAERLRQG